MTPAATLSRAAFLAGFLILLVTGGLVLTHTEDEQPAADPVEHPLPVWMRLTIVSASLLAFFAVSLIATRSV